MYIKKTHLVLIALVFVAFASFSFTSSKSEKAKIENFSISLSVKDIAASKDFYQKLGFNHEDGSGSIDQKWIIMRNGKARIGLFQGMFPQNTISINPDDVRSIYKEATEKGVSVVYQSGMDKAEGPASFMTTDPDGNPILIDQHQ